MVDLRRNYKISSHTPAPVVSYRRRKGGRWWKGVLVVSGATLLTTLAIHASDSFANPSSSLLAGVGGSGAPTHCPPDMIYVPSSGGGFCIDRYEDAAALECPHQSVANQFDTEDNLHNPLCMPVSKKGLTPWVNVPEHEALALCAKAGKRLPSNKEWYRAALGTPDAVSDSGSACAIGQVGGDHADSTGAHPQCFSSYGAYDMVGNVWEWIDGSVTNGMYGNRMIPDEGYVAEVDTDGVATKTGTSSMFAYGNDYFFADNSGVRGMFRGGFWSMAEKAGIWSINATIPTSFVGVAVGFRCAKDAQ